jgi:L-iditol 2-dehydrogenase
MAETMTAAVLRGKEDLRVETVPKPVPASGELLVRVDAALTCGTDLKVFRRGYHAKMLTVDRLFGHELAGTVVEIGEGVTNFAPGDRVVPLNSAPCDECFFCAAGQQNLCEDLLFNNGGYAEFIRVPARIVEKNTLRVPDGMAMEHAALTEPLACVLRGLNESRAQAGQTAVVLGAGPIGLLFVHAAVLMRLQVIAVVKRKDQVAMAKQLGAQHVVRLGEVEDVVAATRALTPDGRGADIVLEAVATPEAWQQATLLARKGGLVNLFGGPPAGSTVTFDTNLVHYSDLTIKASFHHTPDTTRQALAMLSSGKFQSEVFITGEAALSDLPTLYQSMLTRPAEGIVPQIKTAIFPGRIQSTARQSGATVEAGQFAAVGDAPR